MHTSIRPALVTVCGLLLSLSTTRYAYADEPEAVLTQPEAERLFAVDVLPLLKAKCFACHGDDPEDVSGAFDIRARAGLLQGGESGEPAIVPGKPEESLLYQAVLWDGYEMPPKENDRLTPEQIETLRRWIAAGAPWPDEAALERYREEDWASDSVDGIRIATSGGLDEDWTQRRYNPEDVWAFQPVTEPDVPAAGAHPVDAFINARLADAEIEPAPQADPRVLIRRATYDLIGLPPTPREVETFLAEWGADPQRAWTALIDRLLASPHYGERWAQHWLDVVRYADTSGYSNDWERSNAWRYRDYVIRSFNDDKPYDRFILEQIAGDELAAAEVGRISNPSIPAAEDAADTGRVTNPSYEAELLVAVGFLRMGPWEHTPMSPDVVSRQQFLDDVVNSVGQTFLSTAMRCAKCHDHKFDPIPTRDYYRMYAAFATTQPAERPAPYLPEEDRSGFAENRRHVETLLAFAREQRDALYAKREEAARQWYAERGRESEYVPWQERLKLPGDDKPPRFVGLTTAEEGELKVREQDVRIWERCLQRFEPLAQSVYNGGNLYQKSEKLRMPSTRSELARSREMPETFIYTGGSLFSPADPVTPGVLSAVPVVFNAEESSGAESPTALPTGSPLNDAVVPETMDGRRLALARWIADADNPLTTRSIVNRIWQYHFGRGIAGNPNNFGTTGNAPTHPELLDWLAVQFVERGWSIKSLHRLIMTSEAYRRASEHADLDALNEADPNRELYAVFSPRRLTAEELRDSMLAVSGELNRQMGGLPIRPEMNREVALAPRMIQFSLAPAYQPSRTPDQRNRRSIYAYRVRGLADPLMQVFNKPGADESCERRDEPTVTPQVFTLLNSEVVTNRSLAMALRLEGEARTPAEQIARGYVLAFGRTPGDSIRRTLLEHYSEMVEYHRQHQPEPIEYPTRITRSLVEELSGDDFEYVERLDIYENYTPDPQAADLSPETRALADICLLLLNSNEFMYVY